VIRSPAHRLRDIGDNVQIIERLVTGRSLRDFQTDVGLRYAVLHALTIVAEAIKDLPGELTDGHPDVPWRKIVGMGTILKHEYHRVDLIVAWDAVTTHIHTLGTAVTKLLAKLASGG